MFKYLKEALRLRKEALEIEKAAKILDTADLNYALLEKILKGTKREITITFQNGSKMVIGDHTEATTGYVSFDDRYRKLH